MIPSRTSSLHSRITQPIPSTLNIKPSQRTPKTLTHAYMVCGVGREPSQWVKAPAPAQGKIGHMKGAVGQFWLPEILGSSPKLEQDNEIARALYAAMRVMNSVSVPDANVTDLTRPAFLTMSRFAQVEANPTALTTPLFSSKTLHIRCMALPLKCGREPMRSVQKRFATYVSEQRQTSTRIPTKLTGSRIVSAFCRGTLCTIYSETTCEGCGSTGTRPRTCSMQRRFHAYSASQHRDLMTSYGLT